MCVWIFVRSSAAVAVTVVAVFMLMSVVDAQRGWADDLISDGFVRVSDMENDFAVNQLHVTSVRMAFVSF